jgi:hypothetical protein
LLGLDSDFSWISILDSPNLVLDINPIPSLVTMIPSINFF